LLLLLFFFLLLLLGRPLQKSLRLCPFKSDRDEIWQNCSSSKYASIGGDGISEMTSYSEDGGHDVRPPLAATQQRPPAAR